ncbi:hypothetical protein SLEP1_g52119 [Rubroshorea leprosula]|uniref:Uncharacterized protein n=1 Tax=Rubroshorea leprosula TaxID=152421 RepID=A0AAV5M661_9ROSI|nr:hypothetical protein SLEP1_g52119 [Rubroshorea leprosula]
MQRRTKGEDATDDDTPSTSGRQFADSHVSQIETPYHPESTAKTKTIINRDAEYTYGIIS